MVMQRYRYKVPIIKKNLRPTIDLKARKGGKQTECKVYVKDIQQLQSSSFIR